MYWKTLTNHRGDSIGIDADKGRGTVWVIIHQDEEEDGELVSLNEKEFLKLRQMLTDAYSEMEW